MRFLLWALLGLILLPVLAAALYLGALFANSYRASFPPGAEPLAARRPADAVEALALRQASRRSLVERSSVPQILFGDLHVHTVYSADAHLQSVKIRDRVSANPPADACDFARYCSQLDFWSINDHAESLTPDLWRRTVHAVRQCNASAGDPAAPDLVSFLGWEWSHSASTPAEHFGHKNVVVRDIEVGRVPTRPIASKTGPPWIFLGISATAPMVSGGFEEWASFHRYAREALAVEDCPEGVSVRELSPDCRESARDPAALFAKLEDWGFPALVIPHGLAWGITNPAGADLAVQLERHDPRWQRLLEVYSGHGNSEVYREFEWPRRSGDGGWTCPSGGEGFEPCCERAAALARERCENSESADCDARVSEARQRASNTRGGNASLLRAVEGTTLGDWDDCNQLQGAFLPAWSYRPRQSAQYGFALASNAEGEATEARFRWGLIGASDNHRSRPGTGYREFSRQIMTDGVSYPIPQRLLDERSSGFYYTGGLAAVHADGRDRRSIFEALQQRRVYATSGDRILLWFDLLQPGGAKEPMGSEVALAETPRFEVRAVGAWEQKPGCPAFVGEALSKERVASLCQGHCYHPSDLRKRITRIEVVRIRPQADPSEPIRSLIEDPWRSLECPASREGCVVQFDDPEFTGDRRETVYYVRAIQEPSPAVNGAPLRCERDAEGRCIGASLCGDREDGLPDDCLAPVEERAWSSPIFVDFDEES